MIDPVTLIVGALVTGALEGVQTSARSAVVEGYTKLREYLARRYGGQVEASISLLEQHPHSRPVQAAVAEELRNAGADTDQELTQLARRLMLLIEGPEAFVESTPPPDPVEQLRRTTGLRTVGQLLEQHVGKVLAIRSQYDLNDVDLLSGNIARERDLPRQVRDEVTGLHQRIRAVIEQIAFQIEQGRYEEVEQAVAGLSGFAERDRAQRLIQADKQVQIAYDALRLTVEYFSQLNKSVLARIERETSADKQSTMMFGNAVMIYELTDFVIGYIEAFTVSNDLEKFQVEAKKRIQHTRDQQNVLAEMVGAADVEPLVRDQTLEDIRSREAAFDELEKEWDTYLGEVGQLRVKVDEVRGKVPTLAIIRENARIQIMTLQLVAMLRFLKQNSDSIKGAVDTLQGFRLAPLSSSRVRRLVGV